MNNQICKTISGPILNFNIHSLTWLNGLEPYFLLPEYHPIALIMTYSDYSLAG